MIIFVTGETSYMGEALVKEGLQLGHEMIVLTHSKNKAYQLILQGAHPIIGDLLEYGDWQSILNEADAVIHIAAPPTLENMVMEKVAHTYADEHLKITKRLFDVVNPQKVKKIIFVGGASSYGNSGNREPRDDTHRDLSKGWGQYIAPSIEYARSKAKDYPVTIVFPAQIYGSSSWREQLFLEPLYLGKPITSLKGYSPYFSPIHIENCGRACIRLIEHGESGEEYINRQSADRFNELSLRN